MQNFQDDDPSKTYFVRNNLIIAKDPILFNSNEFFSVVERDKMYIQKDFNTILQQLDVPVGVHHQNFKKRRTLLEYFDGLKEKKNEDSIPRRIFRLNHREDKKFSDLYKVKQAALEKPVEHVVVQRALNFPTGKAVATKIEKYNRKINGKDEAPSAKRMKF
ncbi:hypothetical protein QTN25_007160 [Entamoeba marina]